MDSASSKQANADRAMFLNSDGFLPLLATLRGVLKSPTSTDELKLDLGFALIQQGNRTLIREVKMRDEGVRNLSTNKNLAMLGKDSLIQEISINAQALEEHYLHSQEKRKHLVRIIEDKRFALDKSSLRGCKTWHTPEGESIFLSSRPSHS